jgi:hypothetical protein
MPVALTFNDPVPVLVRVTLRGVLVVSSSWFPKARFGAERLTMGAPPWATSHGESELAVPVISIVVVFNGVVVRSTHPVAS